MLKMPLPRLSRSGVFVCVAEQENRHASCALGSGSGVGAGWSSPVARQAHNLKVAGSNPAPATNHTAVLRGGFFMPVSVAVGTLTVIGDVEPLAFRIPRVAQWDHEFDRSEAQGGARGRPSDRYGH